MEKESYKYSELAGKIIGCAMTVHNTLGNGFQELIYQRALALELAANGINFVPEFEMPIYYREQRIGTRRVDLLVDGKVSVELKALLKLEDAHMAQTMNYLEAYNVEVGLLINFGSVSLQYKRLFNRKFKPS